MIDLSIEMETWDIVFSFCLLSLIEVTITRIAYSRYLSPYIQLESLVASGHDERVDLYINGTLIH